jgi:hypothetical protein
MNSLHAWEEDSTARRPNIIIRRAELLPVQKRVSACDYLWWPVLSRSRFLFGAWLKRENMKRASFAILGLLLVGGITVPADSILYNYNTQLDELAQGGPTRRTRREAQSEGKHSS